MDARKRLKAVYRGHVQGVGFRFTVERLAAGFDVGGFVHNESDGSVVVVAEGEQASIERFIEAIESSSVGGFISSKSVEEEPAAEQYNDFRIEY